MEMTIYTFGYGELMYNMLNALAMLCKTELYPTIIKVTSLLVVTYYSWQMASNGAQGSWGNYFGKIIGMVVLINGLLLPKTSMNVKDNVEKNYHRVDNIPVAFALPVGLLENLGNLLTAGFEQAFTEVDSASVYNYHDYGTIFGARLKRDLMHIKAKDPEFLGNLYNFVDRCVYNRAQIGYPFTMDELYSSENIWELVTKNPGTLTRFDHIENGQRNLPTCQEGISYFEAVMGEVGKANLLTLDGIFRAAGKKRVGFSEGAYKASFQNISDQIFALHNGAKPVDKIIKHNMMANALSDYRAGNFSAVRAQMQYEASGNITGDLADWMLTKSLVVMKILMYSSFIFMVPLILMSGGMTKYRNWVTACFSLQLWPSLFAVLNMIIDYSYDPSNIISYSTWATETKKLDSLASVAASLTIFIPGLAFWVTKMGEGGFLHLAGTLMSSANSVISGAAIEKATGNVSWDNISSGNTTRNNLSANKYDDNMQYFSGVNSIQQMDGSLTKTNADGSVVTQRGAGFTSGHGETTYKFSDGLIASEQEAIRTEEQLLSSDSASYSTAKENLISNEVSALETLSKARRSDGNFTFDTSTETGQEVARIINDVERKSQSSQTDFKKAAHVALSSSDSATGLLAKFFTGASGGVSAEFSHSNLDQKTHEIGIDNQSSDRTSSSTKSSEARSYGESLGVDKQTIDTIRSSHNDTDRYEKSIAMHQDNIKAHSKNIDHVRTHSSSYDKDMYQDVVNEYVKTEKVNDITAGYEVSRGSRKAIEIFRKLSDDKAKEVFADIKVGKDQITDPNAITKFSNKYIDQVKNSTNKDAAAYKSNLGLNAVENEIAEGEKVARDKNNSTKT